jgi:hypothetical protein
MSTTSKPNVRIHDIKTNKVIDREMTDKEFLDLQAKLEANNLLAVQQQQEQAEKQALKDSADAKLAALGLTPEEIAAITGAN